MNGILNLARNTVPDSKQIQYFKAALNINMHTYLNFKLWKEKKNKAMKLFIVDNKEQ